MDCDNFEKQITRTLISCASEKLKRMDCFYWNNQHASVQAYSHFFRVPEQIKSILNQHARPSYRTWTILESLTAILAASSRLSQGRMRSFEFAISAFASSTFVPAKVYYYCYYCYIYNIKKNIYTVEKNAVPLRACGIIIITIIILKIVSGNFQ